VQVQTRGGELTIDWPGGQASVQMTGPAKPVFEGQVDLPDAP
jgi:diaminopimelate epimerase